MKKLLRVLLISVFALSACTPSSQPTPVVGPNLETMVALTFEALTAAAPPTAQAIGLPVSYSNISFIIPLELNVHNYRCGISIRQPIGRAHA
jgi:hypothetical protein